MDELRFIVLNDELKKVREEKKNAIETQNYNKAANTRDKELELLEQLGTPVHGWTSEALIREQQLLAKQWQEICERRKNSFPWWDSKGR